METRRDLGAATFAVANVFVEAARVPLSAVERLPGMRMLTREGTAVRGRLRSRLEGVLVDLLCAPEAERAADRVIELFTAEVLESIDVEAVVDDVVVHIVDRALLRPELTRAIARAVASPEVQAALGARAGSPQTSPGFGDL